LWDNGDIDKLLEEAEIFQKRLESRAPNMSPAQLARTIASLVFRGKIREASQLVERNGTIKKGGLMPLTPDVIGDLRGKHPPAADLTVDALIPGVPPKLHPAIFDSITIKVMRKAGLETQGAAGVSAADAKMYQRMMTCYKGASTEFLEAFVNKTKKICTQYIDPSLLEAYNNNRLVPLDKNPGVRPVGIGEVERRIIGKAVLSVLTKEVVEAAGVDQMCTGQPAACETVIHAMKNCFEDEAADGLLL
jgi:hypothetical protein